MSENQPSEKYLMSELDVKRLARSGFANESEWDVHNTQQIERESAVNLGDLLNIPEYKVFSLEPIKCLKLILKEHPTISARAVIDFMYYSPRNFTLDTFTYSLLSNQVDDRVRIIMKDSTFENDLYEVIFSLLKEAGFTKNWIEQYIYKEIDNAKTSNLKFIKRQLIIVLNKVFPK